ncbi:HAD family acid phosphatase [Endozoicomonas sp.]|uniref:HAD family acid phosphatase n=1 Tax=Endozoicomonas sp. TaxID=1892382 RepID=UPI0028876BC9|nr:HAD family acid phosphatase [Endozoicomonas sp.]
MLVASQSPLFTSSVRPVVPTMEQAEQLDRIADCQGNKSGSVAYPHFRRALSNYRIQRVDEGQVMSRLWKQSSAAGHIAFYQSFIHARQTINDRLKQLSAGEKMAVVLDYGIGESAQYFAGSTGRNVTMASSCSRDTHKNQADCSFALPGALEFLKSVKTAPVEIGYPCSGGDLNTGKRYMMGMSITAGCPAVTDESVNIATKAHQKDKTLSEICDGCSKTLFLADQPGGIGIHDIALSDGYLPMSVRENITHPPLGFAVQTNRTSELQSWDDTEMPRAEKPNPMAAQLEQALNYSQSPGYDDLTTQTCRNAIREFDRLTKDLTADRIGQMVVVMDIDGTVVNNSPWIAGLCSKGQLSTQESHSRWAVSQQATAIKGVGELVGAYRKKKVPVIWVSNRTPGLNGQSGDEVRKATEAHLKTLGLFEEGEQVLLKGDRTVTASNGEIDTHKRHRFDAIRQGGVVPGRTEIVQMVGDDPADLEIDTEPFYNVDSDTWPATIKEKIGRKLILMPNPLFYRGWHRDLAQGFAQGFGQTLGVIRKTGGNPACGYGRNEPD